MKKGLPYRRELYRLWFEYLRLAHACSRLNSALGNKVKSALNASASFYAPWGEVESLRFDSWWKDHRHLFEDTQFVRRLKADEAIPTDLHIITVQIPLTQSPTELTKLVGEIIREAHADTDRASKKTKKQPQSSYRPTDGAEPKLLAIRESLTVYRDVHLKNEKLRGQALLDAVRAFYRGRKNKRWAKVPGPLSETGFGGDARAQRNLLRYIKRAETIMLNVARGEFPGRYQN